MSSTENTNIEAPATPEALMQVLDYFLQHGTQMDVNAAARMWETMPLGQGMYFVRADDLNAHHERDDIGHFTEIHEGRPTRRWVLYMDAPPVSEFIGPTKVQCICLSVAPGREVNIGEVTAAPGVRIRVVLELQPDGNRTAAVEHARCMQ